MLMPSLYHKARYIACYGSVKNKQQSIYKRVKMPIFKDRLSSKKHAYLLHLAQHIFRTRMIIIMSKVGQNPSGLSFGIWNTAAIRRNTV